MPVKAGFFAETREMLMYDIIIIGGGVIGCAIAHALTKYELKVALFEKENDIATGTTKANSAIIHAGYDPEPGSLTARLNVRGNYLARVLCKELDVPFKQIGSLVCAFDKEDDATVKMLYERGVENGVPDLKLLNKEEIKAIEPNIADTVTTALYAPTAGVVSPWEYALAFASVAVQNGLELHLSEKVTDIKENTVYTHKGSYTARYIIAAAGVNCNEVEAYVRTPDYTLKPSKGEYFLLDKSAAGIVNTVVFQCPNKDGKGVLVSPTVHGNVIVGPNAQGVTDKESVATTSEGLDFVRNAAKKSIPSLDLSANIRNFAGMRANTDCEDFLIRFVSENMLSLSGIKSPGLASAPAIAEYVCQLLEEKGLSLAEKDDYVKTRRCIRFKELSPEEKNRIIKEDPAYGRIICRCETITEGEIIATFKSPIPPVSIDGVKRRCNAGMGRCQGGFCAPRVLELIHKHMGIPKEEILKDKDGSTVLSGGAL